jgi:hypothetical protein
MRKLFALCIVLLVFLGVAVAQDDNDKKNNKSDSKDLVLKACGPKDHEVNYSAGTDKGEHPTPAPSVGKAMIYVLRATMMGNKVQTKLAVDGEWKGVNRGNNYFFFELAPGEHYVCSQAENRATLTIQVEAGKTYYLQQHIEMGIMKARNSVDIMPEDKAKEKLAKMHLATWQVKN